MRRTPWRAVSLVVILGLALLSCDGPNRGPNTQPSSASGFFVQVTVSPNTLRPGGTAVVTVKVSDTKGNLIDGAPVTVTLSPAKLDKGVATGFTTKGFFTAALQIDDATPLPGTGIVTATSEDATDSALITITTS